MISIEEIENAVSRQFDDRSIFYLRSLDKEVELDYLNAGFQHISNDCSYVVNAYTVNISLTYNEKSCLDKKIDMIKFISTLPILYARVYNYELSTSKVYQQYRLKRILTGKNALHITLFLNKDGIFRKD